MKLFRSRHEQQRFKLQRRTFLAAVGLGISAPVAMRMSQMAIASPTGRPTRLFIYFVPHGAPVEHYEPTSGFDLNVGEGILSPLEPYKQHLTMLRGVSNVVMDNHAAIRSVLTGNDDVDDSIDYIVANQLKTTAHVLGAHPYYANSNGLSHDTKLVRHGAYVTPILNPYDAMEDLFAGLSEGSAGGSEPTVSEADFRQEALNLTIDEVEALQMKVSDLTTESNKLQIHLDSLRALKEATSGAGQTVSCDARPDLPGVTALAGADPFSMSNFAAIIDGHLEAVANAFVCGSARVATLQNMYANAQLNMDFAGGPGIPENIHDPLSHSNGDPGRTNFAVCQRWFYERLATKFLATLDVPDPQDPAHTVLENTTVLTCTEICDGFLHQSAAGEQWLNGGPIYMYLPWNIIGGGGGCFEGGRVVNVEGLDHRQVLAAVARSMGVELPSVAGKTVDLPAEIFA